MFGTATKDLDASLSFHNYTDCRLNLNLISYFRRLFVSHLFGINGEDNTKQ